MRVVSVIQEFLVSCGDQVNSGMNPMIDVSTEEGTQEGFLEEEADSSDRKGEEQ